MGSPAGDWLSERGIGETRLARVERGEITDARIERAGELVAGTVVEARLVRKQDGRGLAEMNGTPLLVEPWPRGRTEGERVSLIIARQVIPERGRLRDAKARVPHPAAAAAEGPERIDARPGDLSEHGWEELIEEARSGVVAFEGGLLSIVPTPAGTTIDIDGSLPPADLARRGAAAAARAIRRLDIGGSILIDLPSLEGKAERQSAAAAFDDAFDSAVAGPFERTGVNGFGLLQAVRARRRPSLIERVQNQPVETGALDLLRRAERAVPCTKLELSAGVRIADWLEGQPALLSLLARRTGGRVTLKAVGNDPLWWGDVHTGP